jgi:hypothetical protein
MEITHHYIHPTPHGGRCRVRIYQGGVNPGDVDELPVVLCTELKDNEGMSITNAVEQIAAEVLANHPDVFSTLAPYPTPGTEYDKPFVWIEHYEVGARGTPEDPATFDLVEFSRYEPKDVGSVWEWHMEIGEPSWKPLDRATVEALVGGPLDEG